jgi:arylformamidase
MRPQQDPRWLEAQYNNRARVADHADVMARWAEASVLARAGATAARLDVPYGAGAGEMLDIFPATRSDAPVLVFIHGGYWRALDKADCSFIAPAFNAQGAMVVVPNYALCPKVSVEHIALQMAAAVAWVWRHAAEYGGNPARIALAGHSAGGHLATMLLTCR